MSDLFISMDSTRLSITKTVQNIWSFIYGLEQYTVLNYYHLL